MASNKDATTRGYHAKHMGKHNTMLHKNMDAFDQLPKALREALANSDHNWSASQALSALRKPKAKRIGRPYENAQTLAAYITTKDKAKHDADAAAGLVCP